MPLVPPEVESCYESPLSPISMLPHAPSDADRHAPTRLLLTTSMLSAFISLLLKLATLFLYHHR
jgi:hypothetical protein